MAAIYSNGGNRWNILGFSFTKRDALSSVYKISMGVVPSHLKLSIVRPIPKVLPLTSILRTICDRSP